VLRLDRDPFGCLGGGQVRGVDDEVGGRFHPRPRLLVVADVIEAPLACDLYFVGLDPFGQNIGVDVKQHVEDVPVGFA
jgi:hypothetical protein